jgi:hypothetical protein
MGYLVKSMNAGVRSPCTKYFRFRRKQFPRRFLQFPLDRLGVVLYLPTAISGAFVFDLKFPGWHYFF